MRDEQDRARERLERRLERLAGLDVEVVRRLVEHEEVRPRGDEQRERQSPSLPAGERGHGPLVRLPPGEEEPPEERLGARPREPGRGGCRIEHRAARRELEPVLREVAGHDAVPDGDLPVLDGMPVEDRCEQRRLARPIRADEPDLLAALDDDRGAVEEPLVSGRERDVLGLEDDAPAPRRVEEVEAE